MLKKQRATVSVGVSAMTSSEEKLLREALDLLLMEIIEVHIKGSLSNGKQSQGETGHCGIAVEPR